jgi:hypothetical protein
MKVNPKKGGVVMDESLTFWIIYGIGVYVLGAICFQRMANVKSIPDAWLAWVPIGQWFLMARISGRSGWYFLLLLIPFVGLIFWIIIWIGIAGAMGRSKVLGVLCIVPFVNFITMPYIAFK